MRYRATLGKVLTATYCSDEIIHNYLYPMIENLYHLPDKH